ncbi:MAG TPA: hypothetical protein VEX41_08890 [Candidatus Eisenbacteria bacterium]|nr:hypothetical protein [Candidatus Eisenbacteria bacterium]
MDQPLKPETWDEVLARHTPEVQTAAHSMLGLILEELPDAVVRFDRGNGLLAVGTGSGMQDLLFALIPHAGWLNLQLADGAVLPNPDGLIEGTGKRIRHIKIRSAEAASSPAVRAAVRAQIAARNPRTDG